MTDSESHGPQCATVCARKGVSIQSTNSLNWNKHTRRCHGAESTRVEPMSARHNAIIQLHPLLRVSRTGGVTLSWHPLTKLYTSHWNIVSVDVWTFGKEVATFHQHCNWVIENVLCNLEDIKWWSLYFQENILISCSSAKEFSERKWVKVWESDWVSEGGKQHCLCCCSRVEDCCLTREVGRPWSVACRKSCEWDISVSQVFKVAGHGFLSKIRTWGPQVEGGQLKGLKDNRVVTSKLLSAPLITNLFLWKSRDVCK